MIKLDILSDPICPWCYIGKANLDRALEALGDTPFLIEWHPFQLNPDMPAGGVDRRDYLEAKFGGQMEAAKAYLNVAEHAKKAGVAINFDQMTRTPNTFDAHRLIHWAGIEGRQGLVVSGLFRAFFVEGRDIGDHSVLADVAEGAGMERSMVEKLLASDADAEGLRTREDHSRKMGVSAVPTFVIGNQYVVQGAQGPDFWTDVIGDIQAALAAEGGPADEA